MGFEQACETEKIVNLDSNNTSNFDQKHARHLGPVIASVKILNKSAIKTPMGTTYLVRLLACCPQLLVEKSVHFLYFEKYFF